MILTYQAAQGQPAYRIDAEALNAELAVALGGKFNGWSSSHNESQAIVTLDASRSGQATQDLVAATVAAHVANTATREAAKAALALGDSDALTAAKANAVIKYLVTHTPAECAAYVQTNVTSLAAAKDMLANFAVALSVLAKQTLR